MRPLPLALLFVTVLLTGGGPEYSAFVSLFCVISGTELLILRISLPHNDNRVNRWRTFRLLGGRIITSVIFVAYSRWQKAPTWAVAICDRICATCVVQYLLVKLWERIPSEEFPRSLRINFSDGFLLLAVSFTTLALPHRVSTQVAFILMIITGGYDLHKELEFRRLKSDLRNIRTATQSIPGFTFPSTSSIARERKLRESPNQKKSRNALARAEPTPIKPTTLRKPDYKTQLAIWREQLGITEDDIKNHSQSQSKGPITATVESVKVREIFSSGRITENLSLNIDWKFNARDYKAISFPENNHQIPAEYIFTSWDNTAANVFSALTFFGTFGISSLLHKHYTVHLIFMDQSHDDLLETSEGKNSDSFRRHITQRPDTTK
jgi:hypothetical protein